MNKPHIRKKIGKKLRLARLHTGMTQVELARRLGVSKQLVAAREAGLCEIGVTSLIQSALALGVEPATMLA